MSPTPCLVALAHYFQMLLCSSSFKFSYLQAAPSMRLVAPTGITVLENSAKSSDGIRLGGSADLLEQKALLRDQDRLMDGLRPLV